jgi:hypothetical protein
MKRQNLIALTLLVAALSTALAFPWLIYWVGLGKIEGRPSYAARAVSSEEIENLYTRLRLSQPVRIIPLSPYSYVLQGAQGSASTRIAWLIARSFNGERLSDHRYWHLSGAALTIWLTRNWTPAELIAKATELESLRETSAASQ